MNLNTASSGGHCTRRSRALGDSREGTRSLPAAFPSSDINIFEARPFLGLSSSLLLTYFKAASTNAQREIGIKDACARLGCTRRCPGAARGNRQIANALQHAIRGLLCAHASLHAIALLAAERGFGACAWSNISLIKCSRQSCLSVCLRAFAALDSTNQTGSRALPAVAGRVKPLDMGLCRCHTRLR